MKNLIAQQTTTPPTAIPTTKAACDVAKMKWDDKGGKDGKGGCVAAVPSPRTGPDMGTGSGTGPADPAK
jgi:hypothetical protein